MEAIDKAKEEDFVFDQPTKLPPWFLPPRIPPNLGNAKKRHSLIPRSKVEHVLLHENVNQKNMLRAKVGHLNNDFNRQKRMTDLHKRAFLVRQSAKQANLWESGIDHVKILPELTVESHLPGAKRASMESATRRYSLALRSARKPRNSTSAPAMYGHRNRLERAQTFHGTTSSFNKENNNIASKSQVVRIDDNAMDKSSSECNSPTRSVNSGHLPRRPLNKTSNEQLNTSSKESFDVNKKSKTDVPLNLTKSFSTYDTKYRREVTIADPRNMKKPRSISEDPRFKRLRTSLIPPGKPIDTMLQLSPSGQQVIAKYGNPLYDYKELKTLLAKMHRAFPRKETEPSETLPKGVLPHQYAHSTYTGAHSTYTGNYALSVREAFVDDESLFDGSINDSSSVILAGGGD